MMNYFWKSYNDFEMREQLHSQYFGSICEFQFLDEKPLGKGSFGQVKLALHMRTSRVYAVKIVEVSGIKTEVGLTALQRETSIHRVLDHPHIIKLWQVLKDDNTIYMVMEYAEKGNLFYFQNKHRIFTEKQASVFFSQVLSASEYLHNSNLLHRDLKPQNLLLDKDDNIKICDFGWIASGIHEKRNTFCGTYEYMAPEMIFDRYYDYRVDIWALGVLLYELLHGFAPFEGEKVEEVREEMLKGELEIDPGISVEAQDLIFNILKADPDERLTIQQIKDHVWFKTLEEQRKSQLDSIANSQDPDNLQHNRHSSRKNEWVSAKRKGSKHTSKESKQHKFSGKRQSSLKSKKSLMERISKNCLIGKKYPEKRKGAKNCIQDVKTAKDLIDNKQNRQISHLMHMSKSLKQPNELFTKTSYNLIESIGLHAHNVFQTQNGEATSQVKKQSRLKTEQGKMHVPESEMMKRFNTEVCEDRNHKKIACRDLHKKKNNNPYLAAFPGTQPAKLLDKFSTDDRKHKNPKMSVNNPTLCKFLRKSLEFV